MELLWILATIGGVLIIMWWTGERGRYFYHHNPARRMCDACGQVQHAYCAHMTEWDNDWWEPVGDVKDPTCKCHEDVK